MHPRKFYDPVKQKQKRYDTIVELLNLKPNETVLNVGCGEGLTFEKFNKVNPITGVDLFDQSKIEQENFKYVQISGDGSLPFKDKEFDVAISIGVFEHIHPAEALQKTADEMRRVARKYLILVPHYNTIIEPHYAFPLFQKLPVWAKKWLHNVLNLRLELDEDKENPYEEIIYYPTRKWLEIFPDAKAMTYRHIGPFITNQIIWKS